MRIHSLCYQPRSAENRCSSCVKHQCEPIAPYTTFMRAVDSAVSLTRPPCINRVCTSNTYCARLFTAYYDHTQTQICRSSMYYGCTNTKSVYNYHVTKLKHKLAVLAYPMHAQTPKVFATIIRNILLCTF